MSRPDEYATLTFTYESGEVVQTTLRPDGKLETPLDVRKGDPATLVIGPRWTAPAAPKENPLIGWFRKWWPWGREEPCPYDHVNGKMTERELFFARSELSKLRGDQAELMTRRKAALRLKKKRSHLDAQLRLVTADILTMEKHVARMEAGK